MFSFSEDLRSNLFMKIPRSYIESGAWKNLSRASKAIYPVIYKHTNSKGSAFPSELTIAILAGVTEKTVREGLGGLDSFPGFKRSKYITPRGRFAYRYQLESCKKSVKIFSISHAFFNGGNWSRLSPAAKAIYLVLKHFGWWDAEIINHSLSSDEVFGSQYSDREYDLITSGRQAVSELSGISYRSIESAYQSLEDNYFIESFLHEIDGMETWKIYTQPPITFEPDFLNAEAKNRYGGI